MEKWGHKVYVNIVNFSIITIAPRIKCEGRRIKELNASRLLEYVIGLPKGMCKPPSWTYQHAFSDVSWEDTNYKMTNVPSSETLSITGHFLRVM